MRNRLLIGTAFVALLAVGAAQAQTAGGGAGAGGAGPGAPAPAARSGGAMGEAPAAGQAGGNMRPDGTSTGGSMGPATEQRGGAMNRNADDRNGAGDNPRAANEGSRSGAGTTTGQAAAGGKMTTEQRSRVSTVIRQGGVKPVTNINFSISVGTRVPREVGFHPLPAEILTIYPDWRGYEFFLARDEIIVVDPRTLEIVAVLPA